VARALEVPNDITQKLLPLEDDYFVIKPQFSGFYATGLPVLLPKRGVSWLILTGIATAICVLFSAADAHMREYARWVPEDCVPAESDQRGRWALDIMRKSMNAEIGPSSSKALQAWLSGSDAGTA
jgi:nicotinamidase-related amidase